MKILEQLVIPILRTAIDILEIIITTIQPLSL